MATKREEFRRERRVTFATRAPLATGRDRVDLIEDSSTVDISESGVRLRFRGQIVPGQIVEVFLSKRPEPCRVVWTSLERATTELVAGLEFIRPLNDAPDPQPPASNSLEHIA